MALVSDGLVAFRVNTVLQTVKLPARVTGLDSGLTEVDRNAFYKSKKTESYSKLNN